MNEYAEYLNFARNLAKKSGKIMRDTFSSEVQKTWKEDATPLTIADTAINKLVIEQVKAHFKDHGVWGEEASYNNQAKKLWVCDPIDGTMPFSHGLPISTFSLGLVIDGEPVVGVVYDPFMDRLFWAAKGEGAYLNDKKIRVSDKSDFKNALIELSNLPASGSASVIRTEEDFARTLNLMGAHTTHLWSTTLPTVLIASGQYAGVVFNLNLLQDIAAAKVIVEEAGGKITDIFGHNQKYDGLTKGFIASNGKLHDQLVEAVAGLEQQP